MRSTLRRIVLWAVVALAASWGWSLSAATYYVSPSGSDANNGASLGAPLAKISTAVSKVTPGDTVYLLGGTYGSANGLSAALTIGSSKSGTAANPINLFAYPGSTPILDFHSETFSGANSGPVGVDLQANYWHLKGITVQYAADNGVTISGSNNTLERMVTRQNQDAGLILKQSGSRIPSNDLILNSDSYGNFDYLTATGADEGGNADGFAAKFRDIGPGNYFIGDRAFNNSDDGYDLWGATSAVTILNSQAFHNGISSVFKTSAGGSIAGFGGNGSGFKLGQDSSTHVLAGDVAWGNTHNGFDINGNARDTVGPDIITHGVTAYNNTAFNNGTVSGSNYRFDDPFPHVLKNNISLTGSVNVVAANVADHNSWNSGFSVTTGDFVSTTDPVIDGVFHPAGPTGGDRDGTTTPIYPTVQPRDPVTGDLLNPSGFLQLKFGDARADVGTASFTNATGGAASLSTAPTVLNFTGVTITLPGFSGAAPSLGAYDVPLAGDFNLDGKLTVADIAAMMSAMSDVSQFQSLHSLTNNDFLTLGDLNGDGQVTSGDLQSMLVTLANNALAGGGSALSPVPEPATAWLAGLGLISLAVVNLQHRRLNARQNGARNNR